MILATASLFIGAVYGWMFYMAVIHKVEWCAIVCAISFAVYEADKFYKSETLKAFIKGFN